MQLLKSFITAVLLFCLMQLFSGCLSYFEPYKTEPARLGAKSTSNKELKNLPKPKEKIVAAVYKFRDQTGQYKSAASGASWSTAVTQGATSILLEALEESDWFIPIEREGLSNLLNERKIIRSSRANFKGADGQDLPPLPPLLYAGILLEGGIISYETNVITGGAGAKYFGAGASGQYNQDRVTIYLRAISTQNGRVLKTVYTSKTILSQLVDVGLFRYVEFKRLLEIEAGYSYNEPPQMCVTAAIDKAVHSLIIEGIIDGLWELENPDDRLADAVLNYKEEKIDNDETDYLNNNLEDEQRGLLSIGVKGGVQKYKGDYSGSVDKPSIGLTLSARYNPNLFFGLTLAREKLSDGKNFTTTARMAELQMTYNLFGNSQITPNVIAGAGILNISDFNKKGKLTTLEDRWLPVVFAGVGAEYLVLNNFGINALVDYHYMLSDKIDGSDNGKINDYYWGIRFGAKFYITP
jgi:curli production assembly/transport component CsgG